MYNTFANAAQSNYVGAKLYWVKEMTIDNKIIIITMYYC